MNCITCAYFQKSANIPKVGNCRLFTGSVKDSDKACSSKVEITRTPEQLAA